MKERMKKILENHQHETILLNSLCEELVNDVKELLIKNQNDGGG